MQMTKSPAAMIGIYHKTSNISSTVFGNKIVDHSDAVGALSVNDLVHLILEIWW